MKIYVGAFLLYDSTANPVQSLSDYSPDIQRVIQIIAPVRAEEISTRFRGLRQSDLSFTISRQHASEDDVIGFLSNHEAQIPSDAILRIVARTNGGGEKSTYYRGNLQSLTGSHIGRRSMVKYKFVAGKPYPTLPVYP